MKTHIKIAALSLSVLVFSGCSLSSPKTETSSGGIVENKPVGAVSFLKTTDGGKSWAPKVKVNETQNIAGVDIISMAIDPNNTGTIYAGTDGSGLFVSKDAAETWQKLNFPPTKIYGVAIDPKNSQNIYASGLYNSRAKIYRSTNSGTDWQEIYTEPASGAIITSLAISQSNSQILYAGTDQGAIFSSSDGGQTWKNIYKAGNAVISISFSNGNNTIYFGVFTQGLLRIKNGGNIEDLSQKINSTISGATVYSALVDPSISGRIYLGLSNGIMRSNDFGDSWEKVNILESSSKYPIWGLAVNPKNSNEIMYSNSGAIYKSTDGGNQWSTFQLASGKSVRVLKYDPQETSTVYAGLKKE
jgi:photosystem II stability/assembly factor-like uncharacterized protein